MEIALQPTVLAVLDMEVQPLELEALRRAGWRAVAAAQEGPIQLAAQEGATEVVLAEMVNRTAAEEEEEEEVLSISPHLLLIPLTHIQTLPHLRWELR